MLTEPERFGERFGLVLVEGCVATDDLEAVVDALEAGVDPAWFAHLITDVGAGEVVGLGGFTGPPVDGEVEIGYGVAPLRRGRGHATAAVRTWVEQAAALRVRARTSPGETASTTVLRRSGFVRDPDAEGTEDAAMWAWTLPARRAHRS